ncbi:sensor histidine kinase [Pendulispora albinea]|uniref:histidine kinase n=1 Tax=Pendulispora albinea TaxID=2741071 RepID=A0ABZ2LSE5_9BACT
MSTGKNLQRLGYRRIVQLLIYLVIIPTVLLLTLGFVLMFLGEGSTNLLLGILTVTFVSVAVTGVILVLVFVRREANLSELQADFVSKVSHELRTPLTAIRLFAETIERSRDDEKTVDQCLDHLLGECERLTGRIQRLLDWGRMEAGRRFYDLREQSLSEVMEQAVAGFTALRTDKVDFASEIEPDLPKILADRDALVDAIVNLLSNAHKYGGTPPVVRLRAFAPAVGGVAISVTDNGPGIARPEHRRIFQKFYRIDDRLSREREGSGLGLAIVKHVVRAHRGRIVLESAPGKGSTFTLVLPTPRVSRRQQLRQRSSSASPSAEASGSS